MIHKMCLREISNEQFIMLVGMRLEGMVQDWYSLWWHKKLVQNVPTTYMNVQAFWQQMGTKFISANLVKRLGILAVQAEAR